MSKLILSILFTVGLLSQARGAEGPRVLIVSEGKYFHDQLLELALEGISPKPEVVKVNEKDVVQLLSQSTTSFDFFVTEAFVGNSFTAANLINDIRSHIPGAKIMVFGTDEARLHQLKADAIHVIGERGPVEAGDTFGSYQKALKAFLKGTPQLKPKTPKSSNCERVAISAAISFRSASKSPLFSRITN